MPLRRTACAAPSARHVIGSAVIGALAIWLQRSGLIILARPASGQTIATVFELVPEERVGHDVPGAF